LLLNKQKKGIIKHWPKYIYNKNNSDPFMSLLEVALMVMVLLLNLIMSMV